MMLMCCVLQTFLEQGQYTSVEASRHDKGAKGEAKESKTRIHRTIGRNRPIRYEITDRAPSDKASWDRVVALFCLGKAWQFKSYPKQLFPVMLCTALMLCMCCSCRAACCRQPGGRVMVRLLHCQ